MNLRLSYILAACVILSTPISKPSLAQKSAVATAHVKAPYSARTIAELDLGLLEQSISSQLRDDLGTDIEKIKIFDLFNAKDRLESGYSDSKHKEIVGINDAYFLAELLKDKSAALQSPSVDKAACENLDIHALYGHLMKAVKIQAALHEVFHFIDEKLHVTKGLVKHLSREKGSGTFALNDTNIRERLADTAAVIYLLANIEDHSEIKELNDYLIHYRNLNLPHNADHMSANSIEAAIKYFDAAPQKGLSLVQSIRTAAEIIGKQLTNDVNFALIVEASALAESLANPILLDILKGKSPDQQKAVQQYLSAHTRGAKFFCAQP
jgi:hypothetical protein